MTMEAEQNLLGMAMLDTNSAIKLLEIPEDWFSINAHKLIYRAISSLTAQGLSVDSIELGNSLFAKSDNIDGLDMEYLMTLESEVTKLSHFEGYKNAMFKSYKNNRMQNLVTTLQRKINNADDFQETVGYLQDSVFELLMDHNTSKPELIGKYIDELAKEMQWKQANPNESLSLKTGFEQFDNMLSLEKGKMYVGAGRPGAGKSQFFLVNIGMRVSREKQTVAFSLEMTGKALAARAISSQSGIYGNKIKDVDLTEEEWTNFAQSAEVIHKQNKLYIDETPNLSTAQIRARLKALQLKNGEIGSVIIDHVGLVKKDPRKSETEALTQISHEFQQMAKEFDCVFIVLSQLNRGVESRPDKRPVMSDLKQSGALEEDARGIILLYRDDYYNTDTNIPNVTEVDIAKNSDGATGKIYFNHDLGRAFYSPIDNFSQPEKPKKGKF